MRRAALVAIALANVLGGLSYLWQDLALAGLPPLTVAFARNLVGVLLLLAWIGPRRPVRWRYPRADVGRLLLLGTAAYAVPMALGLVGVRWSSAGNGAILILLEPAAILVFARLLLGEHVRPRQAWGVGLGLAGALFIVTESAPVSALLESRHLQGNLLLVLHGVLWGLYTPLMRGLALRHDPFDLTLAVMTVATAALVPGVAWEWDAWSTGPALGRALVWVAVLGVLVSFGGTVLWTLSLRHLRAGTVAAFVFLQPVAGVAADYLVQGRALSGQAALGAGIIGVGVMLVMRRPARTAPRGSAS